jgi:hypothetical protein
MEDDASSNCIFLQANFLDYFRHPFSPILLSRLGISDAPIQVYTCHREDIDDLSLQLSGTELVRGMFRVRANVPRIMTRHQGWRTIDQTRQRRKLASDRSFGSALGLCSSLLLPPYLLARPILYPCKDKEIELESLVH